MCCILLLPATMSLAQDRAAPELVTQIVDNIEASLLAADDAASDTDKLDHYLAALDRIVYLKNLGQASAPPDGKFALDAIANLSVEGASADNIRSLVLSTLYRLVATGDDQTAWRVEIDKQLAAMESPQLRVSGYVEFAMIDTGGEDGPTALPLLQKAATYARSIQELESRSSALGAIALASASFEGDAARNLVNQTIAEIWPARARGFARYVIAQQTLAGGDLIEASSDDLGKASKDAAMAGDLDQALALALGIDPEEASARTEALDRVLSAALDANRIELFPIFATAYSDEGEQQKAISKLIDNRLQADRLLDVLGLTAYLPDGPSRAAIEFSLSTALDEAGLTQMATDAFERGTAVVASLNGIQQDVARSHAIDTALAMGKLDVALELFAEVKDAEQMRKSSRRLSKALADDGQIVLAQKVFQQIIDADDREYALSGIAQAQVKTGDVEAGVAALESITNPEYRGRVQAELARSYAKGGRFEDALATIAEIADLNYSVQGYLNVAKAAVDGEESERAAQANDLALALVQKPENVSQRWKLTVDIVGSIASTGDFEAARTIANSIPDEVLRAKAISVLSQQASSASNRDAAMDLLATVPNDNALSGEIADGLVSLSRDPNLLQRVAERVRTFEDDHLRVATFRRIAEGQLARLDVFGHGQGSGVSKTFHADFERDGSVVAANATPSQPLYSNGRFEALALTSTPEGVRRFGFPNLDRSVHDLRSIMPTPTKGNVSVTLANLSPYNGKFLEDLSGGHTGMQIAATAQGELQPRIIVIESGIYTLGQLADELVDTGGFSMVRREGDVVTLRAPVIVGEDATLILNGQEVSRYNLSATSGAFIAVAGTLFVIDANVQSWDEAIMAPREANKTTAAVFRPFFVGWSGSTINFGGSSFNALGYAAPKSFGLAFSAGPKELLAARPETPNPTGTVVDNFFRNFEYGFYSYEADDVFLVGNQYDDNVVYAIDPHDRSHRLVIGLNTTYGTQSKHGIIISREVDNSWIVGNVSFDNHGSGLMLDRDSTGTLIYGNVAFGNHQDGLTLFESSCNLIIGNDFFSNNRTGMKVRNSWDVGIYHNKISNNAEAGLEAYTAQIEATSESRDFVMDPYVAVTSFSMGQNDIVGNGSGLKVSGVSGYSVFGSNFQAQNGPLATGDAKGLESFLVAGNLGRAIISQKCLPKRPANVCPFRDLGIFASDGQELGFSASSRNSCESAVEADMGASPSPSVSN